MIVKKVGQYVVKKGGRPNLKRYLIHSQKITSIYRLLANMGMSGDFYYYYYP